ncbi:unnamed protein product, partial [Allacma fusca]
ACYPRDHSVHWRPIIIYKMEDRPGCSPEVRGRDENIQLSESDDVGKYLNMLKDMLNTNPNNEVFKLNIRIVESHSASGSTEDSSITPEAISDLMDLMNEDTEGVEPYSNPVLYYNLAVLFFHCSHYAKVEYLLSKLMSDSAFTDPASALAIKIRLLRIDAYVKSKEFGKAISAIEEFELFRSQMEPESNKSTSPGNVSPSFVNKVDEEFDSNLKTRLQMYKTLCCLSTRSFKLAKRECKLLFGLLGTTSHSHVGGMNLKAYQEYLRGNINKAINFIRAVNVPANVSKKSTKVFESTGELITAIAPNNEACCHFYLGRPLGAAFLFKKAILAFDAKIADKPLPVYATKYKKYQVECLYNFGVACLHAKDPDRAFHCLKGCIRHFGTNPRLWLRLAECCIHKHKATNEFDMQWTEEKKNLLLGIKCAQQDSPKLLFSEKFSNSDRNVQENSERNNVLPTLHYGSDCIATALALMKPIRNGSSVCLQVPPSNPLTSEGAITALHASILCAGAYIAISIGNFPMAVKRSRDLLGLPNIPGSYQYLGKQYLSQALLLSGDVVESIKIAENEEEIIDLGYCVSPFEGPTDDKRDECGEATWPNAGSHDARKPLQVWFPRDEPTAKMFAVYNRASILATSGKLDKADEVLRIWLTQTTGILLPPEFLMLAVYLHIQRGNISKAVSLLKEHSPTASIT